MVAPLQPLLTQPSTFSVRMELPSSDGDGASLLAEMQSMAHGLVILDAQCHITLLNPCAEAMFGYGSEQLYGHAFELLLPLHEQVAQRVCLDQLCMRVAQGHRMKNRMALQGIRASGEEFPMQVMVSRVTVQGQIFLAFILHDLGARRKVERRRRFGQPDQRRISLLSQLAREVEKKRFSRELYDDLAQRLSVLKLDFDWLEENQTNADAVVQDRLQQMQGLLDDIISSTKHIASSLRPPLLDDFGLMPAVEWMAANFRKRTTIDCQLDNSGMTIKPREPVASAMFRIIQEGLLNIERHARARHVKITLWQTAKYPHRHSGRRCGDDKRIRLQSRLLWTGNDAGARL
ncbi:PAS domain S-box protein [Undibacterium arcticum]|uniref:sensor histidine kinase n=1 Tax=Undibacterium arcticum TaxID=1762892 RepID=UPI003607F0D0